MTRIVTSASETWSQSIIDRREMSRLFERVATARPEPAERTEASKLVLVGQTTFFVFRLFDKPFSKKQVEDARKHLDAFLEIAHSAPYLPPAGAIRKLEEWLAEEEKAFFPNHRRIDAFDAEVIPWLTAFAKIVFQPDDLMATASLFIKHYFLALKAALDDQDVLDPELRNRHLKAKSFVRTLDAVKKAIKRNDASVSQYENLIEAKISGRTNYLNQQTN